MGSMVGSPAVWLVLITIGTRPEIVSRAFDGMVPSAFAAVIGAHLPSLVVLRRWQRAELAFNVVLAAVRCAALLWGHHAGDPLSAIVAYGVIGALLVVG